jgi:rare lipoprotein A
MIKTKKRRFNNLKALCLWGTLLGMILLTGCMSKRPVVVERRPEAPESKRVAKAETPPAEKIEKRESKGVQYGVASWYGPDFHGKPTSSGEIYDMYQLTCAHNTLPLGTTVIVTNLENGKSLELKVNDRGPFVKDRIIDLSYSAAKILEVHEKGTAYVKVETVGPWIDEIFRFTLQVGSFTDEAKAQRLAESLRGSFENVYVTTVETSTQKYHRVRVGQYDSKELALVTAEKLSRMGYEVLVTSR